MLSKALGFSLVVAACAAALHGCLPPGSKAAGASSENLAAEQGQALVGSWQTPCAPDTSDPGRFEQSRAQLSINTDNETIGLYSDSACAHPLYVVTIASTYTVGTQVNNTTQMDLLVSTVTMTVDDPVIASAYAVAPNPPCGIRNWIVGQPRPVNGCQQFGSLQPGMTLYDIFSVNGNQLLFGNTNGNVGSTPQTRPTLLDATMPYMRIGN